MHIKLKEIFFGYKYSGSIHHLQLTYKVNRLGRKSDENRENRNSQFLVVHILRVLTRVKTNAFHYKCKFDSIRVPEQARTLLRLGTLSLMTAIILPGSLRVLRFPSHFAKYSLKVKGAILLGCQWLSREEIDYEILIRMKTGD